MLLASVPPSEACKPPAPNGKSDSASEKKNRAASLSCALRNSRSQFAVNWSSVYLPGLLTINGAVFRLAKHVSALTVIPGVPGSDGYSGPMEFPVNWPLVKLTSFWVTGSIVIGTAGQHAGFAAVGGVAGVLNTAARLAVDRSAGKIGRPGL